MTLSTPSPGSADVGLVGLAVMGQNLVLNMADHGFQVAVYNRTTATTEKFVADNPPSVFGGSGGGLIPGANLDEFVRSIKRPRRIINIRGYAVVILRVSLRNGQCFAPAL